MGNPAICSISAKVNLKLSLPFPLIYANKASYLLIKSPNLRLIVPEKLPDVLAHHFHNFRLPVRFPVA